MRRCKKGTMSKGEMARWEMEIWLYCFKFLVCLFVVFCFVFFKKKLNVLALSVWFAVVALVYLELSTRAGSAPTCAYGQAGCRPSSLADLFDRVIQQSSRMHSVSSDLHSEFVSSDPRHPSPSITARLPFTHQKVTPFVGYFHHFAVVFAGAILLSQQKSHGETEVPHVRHTNARG